MTTVWFVFDLSGFGWRQSHQPNPLKSQYHVIQVIANEVKQSVLHLAVLPDNNVKQKSTALIKPIQ